MATRSSNKLYVTEEGTPIHGILAEFGTPASVYHACEKVRDAGYARWDMYSPFPMHGVEGAMGIRRTRLPLLVGLGAIAGVGSAYLMQWWMSNNYQLLVQGKPFGGLINGGWEAFVPITFELGVLFSAFTALIGMLALNGLPRWHHPLMKSDRFLSSSDDTFFICVEASDDKFDPDRTRAMLLSLGARHIELVEE